MRKKVRGRKPSIGTATARVQSLRRSLKSLVAETKRIEAKLADLDSYYSKVVARSTPASRSKSIRGRGPNIRDIAAEVLGRKKKPMAIADLAAAVMKRKKGEPGSYFTQNLGIALTNDKRFKRAGRGMYGLRFEIRQLSASREVIGGGRGQAYQGSLQQVPSRDQSCSPLYPRAV